MSCSTPARRSITRFRFAAALLVAPLFACDSYEDEPEPESELQARVLVGAVDDTDIVLGVLIDGDDIAVYQCGGPRTVQTHTLWYRGSIGDAANPDAFDLEADGFRLVGMRSADGLGGELLDPSGDSFTFVVDPVAEGGAAGVYLGIHDGLHTGIIVRGEGDDLTAQGATCGRNDPCSQVIILSPIAIVGNGLTVTTEPNGVEVTANQVVDPAVTE